ncbi:MAG: class A beta-lactamase-related serine hydrolase [Sphingobacteriia bacterium]|nr:MAG: class A beta-lactamase-related serine hydrolase [Sphingobacteriia bacterium]
MIKKITQTFFAFLTLNAYSQKYPTDILARIKRVENEIAERITINNKFHTLKERMDYYKIPGISVAVVKDYKIEWAKAYGYADVAHRIPMTTQTLIPPGSISKSFNALAFLKLAQEGKIDLNTDINTLLKSWQFPYDSLSKGKKITLSQLLSHTAGLSVYGGYDGYDPKGYVPTLLQQIIGIESLGIPAVKSLFEPGKEYEYSGGGISLSELILTDQSKQPYDVFLKNYILTPLGMKGSRFSVYPPQKNWKQKVALGYDDGILAEKSNNNKVFIGQSMGGLWTTPIEVAKYIIEIQKSIIGKSNKVLNKEYALKHLERVIGDVTIGSYVQDREETKYFFHDASNWGHSGVYFGTLNGGNGVVIFTNHKQHKLNYDILNTVGRVYGWSGFIKPENVNTITVPKEKFKKFEGFYLFENSISHIYQKKDGLYLWSGDEDKIYFTKQNEFINVNFPAVKSFVYNNNHEVIGYTRKVGDENYPPAIKVENLDTLNIQTEEIVRLGYHLLRLDTKKAKQCFQNALHKNANDLHAKIGSGLVFLIESNFDKSLKIFTEILSTHINDKNNPRILIFDNLERYKALNTILFNKTIQKLKIQF